jgi:tRNA (cmo5U34)-methyltransferase
LRADSVWSSVFRKCHRALRTGGAIWISDLVAHQSREVQAVMWARYGAYLEGLRGPEYREHVFAYIEQEDTPRTLLYQLDLLRDVGFREAEILHKNGCFAAFGAIK